MCLLIFFRVNKILPRLSSFDPLLYAMNQGGTQTWTPVASGTEGWGGPMRVAQGNQNGPGWSWF